MTNSPAFGGSQFTAKRTYGADINWVDWVYAFFDGNRNAGDYEGGFGSNIITLCIYNPVPIRIKRLHIICRADNVSCGRNWTAKGSNANQGSGFETIATYSIPSGQATAHGAELDILWSTNVGFYKYYRFEITNLDGYSYWGMCNIDITATYKTVQPDYYNTWTAENKSSYFIKY